MPSNRLVFAFFGSFFVSLRGWKDLLCQVAYMVAVREVEPFRLD